MHKRGRIGCACAQLGRIDQAQLLQHHQALAPRPALGHAVAAKVVPQRGFNLGLPSGHVGPGQQTHLGFAAGVHHRCATKRIHSVGHKTLVPNGHSGIDLGFALGAFLRGLVDHALIGLGQGRVGHERAGSRHAPLAQPLLARAGPICFKQGLDRRNGLGHAWQHRKALGRQINGGRHHIGQRPGAMVFEQPHPGPKRTGHGGGQQADAGHLFHAPFFEISRCGRLRCAALACDHLGLAKAFTPHHDGHFTAWAIQVGLDHLQHHAACHRRIEGIAAALEHPHGGLGGQPVRGRSHAKGAADLGPGGEHGVPCESWVAASLGQPQPHAQPFPPHPAWTQPMTAPSRSARRSAMAGPRRVWASRNVL